jgi:hypothetical protein
MTVMTNLDDLVEAARGELEAVDAQIDEARRERVLLNDRIKELAVRRKQVARMVKASQPRTRRASGDE